MLRRGAQLLKKNYGGVFHYLGSRYLSAPDLSGHMRPDMTWLNEHFSIILSNNKEKYKRCIEPFSGSASWSLAAMEVGLAKKYLINDSDATLINALQLVQRDPKLVKNEYAFLLKQYESEQTKKQFFLDTVRRYNTTQDKEEKSLLLPFVINHSWGGIIFHNSHDQIVYQEQKDHLFEGEKAERFLTKANLSLSEFHHEVDRVSQLLNENDVEFMSGDFLRVLSDVGQGDFIGLNPPYPENTRSLEDKTGMYTELYSPEKLHANLVDVITVAENAGIHYYMTYGLYNPNLNQFVLQNDLGQPKNHFRMLGYAGCAFGTALDQMYWTPRFTIPDNLRSMIVPAQILLEGKKITPEDAMKRYMELSRKDNLAGLIGNFGVFKQLIDEAPASNQSVTEENSHVGGRFLNNR